MRISVSFSPACQTGAAARRARLKKSFLSTETKHNDPEDRQDPFPFFQGGYLQLSKVYPPKSCPRPHLILDYFSTAETL